MEYHMMFLLIFFAFEGKLNHLQWEGLKHLRPGTY